MKNAVNDIQLLKHFSHESNQIQTVTSFKELVSAPFH